MFCTIRAYRQSINHPICQRDSIMHDHFNDGRFEISGHSA